MSWQFTLIEVELEKTSGNPNSRWSRRRPAFLKVCIFPTKLHMHHFAQHERVSPLPITAAMQCVHVGMQYPSHFSQSACSILLNMEGLQRCQLLQQCSVYMHVCNILLTDHTTRGIPHQTIARVTTGLAAQRV